MSDITTAVSIVFEKGEWQLCCVCLLEEERTLCNHYQPMTLDGFEDMRHHLSEIHGLDIPTIDQLYIGTECDSVGFRNRTKLDSFLRDLPIEEGEC